MTEEPVEVIQADRQAAADFVAWNNKVTSEWETVNGGTMQFFTSNFPDAIRHGTWDEHPVVQAFARHRLSHSAEKEALIEALVKSCSYTGGHGPAGEFVSLQFHTRADREAFLDAYIAVLQVTKGNRP